MVDLRRTESSEVPFQGSRIGGIPGDRSAETAARAIGGLVNTFAPIVKQKIREGELGNIAQGFDSPNLTDGAIESVGIEARSDNSPEDQNIISQMQRENKRLNLMVEQGQLRSTSARTARLARAAESRAAYPHLIPEIDNIYESKFGISFGEESLAAREDALSAGVQKKAAFEKGVTDTSKLYNIPTSLPIQQQLELQKPFVQANIDLNLLVQNNKLADAQDKGNKRLNDQKILAQLPDSITLVGGKIRGISAGIDPATASPEQVQDALQQLQNLRLGVVTLGQQQFGLTHTVEEVAASNATVLQMVDNAMQWIDGTTDRTSVENAQAVIEGTAYNRLLQQPGVAENLAKMKALQGVANLVSTIPTLASSIRVGTLGEQGSALVKSVTGTPAAPAKATATPQNNWFDKMLTTAQSRAGAKGWGTLEATFGEEAAAAHIQQFSQAVQANFDNEETSDFLLSAMTKYTNDWQDSAEEIPMEVYDSMLDIVADEQWIKFRGTAEAQGLPSNLVSGFDAATQRMRNSLASDMGQMLNIPFDVHSLDGKILIGDALQLDIADDGGFSFLPNPALLNDKNTFKVVNSLNRTYGTFFGKLARSYAHEVQGDKNYRQAAMTLLSTGEFKRAGEGFGQPAAQAEEIQVWVRDENGNLTQENN